MDGCASQLAHSPVEEPRLRPAGAVTDEAAVGTRSGLCGRQSRFPGMKPRGAVAGLEAVACLVL